MSVDLWADPVAVAAAALRGVLVYVVALVAVRLAGRRTLAQLSAFDVVVTIALGSLAASAALPSSPSVAEGAAVIGAFVGMQELLGAARRRWPRLRPVTDFRPVVVVADGALRLGRTGMTDSELRSKLRQAGITDLRAVHRAVLEPTGRLSVTLESGPLFEAPGDG